MSNIFSLKKKNKEKNKENKAKEEEEINLENSICAEIIPMNYGKNMDLIANGLKIKDYTVESFDKYNKKVEKLIKRYGANNKECDYRIEQLNKGYDLMLVEGSPTMSIVDKYKKIGKIGDCTILDKESSNEDLDLRNEKLRICAVGSFTSVRANNCVVKGKWCYEVILLSNKICQIGWCQINTPFKTKEGVGDDLTSYAYDGFRVLKWGGVKKQESYGKNWDIGDIIGVCIDLDNRFIEFYINGQSLGQAFTNISTGPNFAYFPGVSMSKNEKILFNFGNQKMVYTYSGYEPLDVPQSVYKHSLDVTFDLLSLTKSYILKLFATENLDPMYKLGFSSQIFNFLANVSFKDTHTFTKAIIPFFISCSNNNPITQEDLANFFENIYIYVDNKPEFTSNLFEKLTTLIEFHSARGYDGLTEREEVMKIFNKLLGIDFIVQYWVEGRKYVDHLKSVISGNFLKTSDILYYIIEKINKLDLSKEDKKSLTINKMFFYEVRREYEERVGFKGMTEFDSRVNTSIQELIKMFSEDKRTFRANNKNFTLLTILMDYYAKSVKESSFQGGDIVNFLHGHSSFTSNENFIKFYYFNLLELFSKNFTLDLKNFSIEPWISRLRAESLYHDEIGVGGTISHVTIEYGDKIDSFFKEKQDNTLNYIFHRLLNLTSNYIIPFFRDFLRNQELINDIKFQNYEDESKRASYIHTLYRTYFNIFNQRNQILLYQFSYFLINWLNSLIKTNKDILYFIPKSIMQMPYEIFKFLKQIKTPIFQNFDLIKNLNAQNPYFADNKYIHQILFFYCYMFNDSKIANPELKEGFMNKISFFLKKKSLIKCFEENEIILELLIKGLIQYMTNEMMCHLASENMVKIIKSCCFGEKQEHTGKGTLIKVVKKFFETNIDVFHEFMDNYNKLLNKIMTDYTMCMTEAGRGNHRAGVDQFEHAAVYTKKTLFSYSVLCDLMKILEFLLTAYPTEFLDVSTINFSRFSNFLKNLSSRILDSNYKDKLLKIIEKFKPGKSLDTFSHIAYSTIGIFLNMFDNQNTKNFNDFITKLVAQSDFDTQPFYNVIEFAKIEEHTKSGVEKYKEVIDYISSLKLTKMEKKMSEAEWDELMKRDDVCILCYANQSDRILIPCKHGCCNQCLMQYLIDKKNCFICNTLIEKTEEVSILKKTNNL